MTINLTPAELRRWAELFRTPRHSNVHELRALSARLRAAGDLASCLAITLADAIDEIAELKGNYVHADVALDAEGYKRKCKQLETDLEAAREAINYATENILDYDDAEWAAWNAMPAVRAALGKDADGND